MIFLDTNVFVEAFGRPIGERIVSHESAARALLDAVGDRRVEATTSEAILVEATQVLTRESSYGWPTQLIATHLSGIIRAEGLRLASKHVYLRALDIWADRPGLGFVDALTVAYVEQGDIELASFDRQLLGSPGVAPYWQATDAPLD